MVSIGDISFAILIERTEQPAEREQYMLDVGCRQELYKMVLGPDAHESNPRSAEEPENHELARKFVQSGSSGIGEDRIERGCVEYMAFLEIIFYKELYT